MVKDCASVSSKNVLTFSGKFVKFLTGKWKRKYLILGVGVCGNWDGRVGAYTCNYIATKGVLKK